MRPYTRIVAAGAGSESRIAARGRTVFVVSSTAGIVVTMRAIETGKKAGLRIGPITMNAGNQFTAEQTFDDVTLRNESGVANTVVILIGVGDFDAPLTSVDLAAASGANHAAVTMGVAAAVIRVANAARANIVVQNLSVNDVYIGFDGTVTTANGIRLVPDGSVTLTHTAAVWGIADAAGSDVRYFEETV